MGLRNLDTLIQEVYVRIVFPFEFASARSFAARGKGQMRLFRCGDGIALYASAQAW